MSASKLWWRVLPVKALELDLGHLLLLAAWMKGEFDRRFEDATGWLLGRELARAQRVLRASARGAQLNTIEPLPVAGFFQSIISVTEVHTAVELI